MFHVSHRPSPVLRFARCLQNPLLPLFGGKYWTHLTPSDTADFRRVGWRRGDFSAAMPVGHETLGGYRADGSRPLRPYTGPLDSGEAIDRWPAYLIAPKDQPLQTSRMRRCAALVIAGPEKHYMLHLNPVMPARIITDHLREVIDWDLSQSRVFVLPGTRNGTDKTVKTLMYALNKLDPDVARKVEFVHYPLAQVQSIADGSADEADTAADWLSMVSYNGEVYYRPLPEGEFDFPVGGGAIHPDLNPFQGSTKGVK